MWNRERLLTLFRERALKFGDFKLASGKMAKYYLDGKQIALHSEGLWLVSEGLLELIAEFQFDAIGGMSLGADPIVGGVLAAAGSRGRSLTGFLVRKEAKEHGTQKFIEGPLVPGNRVIIVDDVITTGGSSLKAIDRVQEFGCQVVAAVCLVDRMEGGAQNFAARNIPFRSLLTIADFGLTPPS